VLRRRWRDSASRAANAAVREQLKVSPQALLGVGDLEGPRRWAPVGHAARRQDFDFVSPSAGETNRVVAVFVGRCRGVEAPAAHADRHADVTRLRARNPPRPAAGRARTNSACCAVNSRQIVRVESVAPGPNGVIIPAGGGWPPDVSDGRPGSRPAIGAFHPYDVGQTNHTADNADPKGQD
jgi:hypothetical protein